jgi:hypothetical protein
MNPTADQLREVRDKLSDFLRKEQGVEAVSVTKDEKGTLALAVQVHERFWEQAKVLELFGGMRVLRQKASEFVLH